jgi:hypothetical protein
MEVLVEKYTIEKGTRHTMQVWWDASTRQRRTVAHLLPKVRRGIFIWM